MSPGADKFGFKREKPNVSRSAGRVVQANPFCRDAFNANTSSKIGENFEFEANLKEKHIC